MPLDHAALADLAGSEVVSSQQLTGGDVAESSRVELADGRVLFAKTHSNPPKNFFTTEALGLSWLRRAEAVHVPEVVAASDAPPLLVLDWIEETPLGQPDEEVFGRSLAALHQAGADVFGRSDHRTTGSRGLPNEPCESWALFYATQRLLPLAKLAQDSAALSLQAIAGLGSVAARLPHLGGPAEPAARLHGDLWAGNRIVDANGQSWLIDPACHGGHREFDLAMMRLFGGFGPEAFAAYDEHFPLADGASDRVKLHQLAPLVVHAIKFGGSYVSAAESAIATYA